MSSIDNIVTTKKLLNLVVFLQLFINFSIASLLSLQVEKEGNNASNNQKQISKQFINRKINSKRSTFRSRRSSKSASSPILEDDDEEHLNLNFYSNKDSNTIDNSSGDVQSYNTKTKSRNFGYLCTAESTTPFNIKDGLSDILRDGMTADFTSTRAMLLRQLEALKASGSYKDLEEFLLRSAHLIDNGFGGGIMSRSMTPSLDIGGDHLDNKNPYPSSSRRLSKFHHDPNYVKTWKCCNNIRYDSLNLDCCKDLSVAQTCEGFSQWSSWSQCPSACGQKNNTGKTYQTRTRNCIGLYFY